MKTICFRNTKGRQDIYAELYTSDESVCERVKLLDKDAQGDFLLKIDDIFDHVRFIGDGEQTEKIYCGNIDIGIEYKENDKVGRSLTYLLPPDEISGRVDNYVVEDTDRLSYRADRSKKISVFVPSTYDGKTPHDVLYFFDAQNLFKNAGEYTENADPYGSWQLDSVIGLLHRQSGRNIIVVGIDNADEYRTNELFMHPDVFGALSPLATAIPEDNYSVGYLDRLNDFMVEKLHPFIKEKYCVKDDNVGIGGASMGGIASFYCALHRLGFYSYVLSYSPAFGLYEMSAFENYFKTLDFSKNYDRLPKIHIYCGEGDMLERMLIPSSRAMKGTLIREGYPSERIFETFDTDKAHNEESWRLILPQSFGYLL